MGSRTNKTPRPRLVVVLQVPLLQEVNNLRSVQPAPARLAKLNRLPSVNPARPLAAPRQAVHLGSPHKDLRLVKQAEARSASLQQ